MRLAQEGTFVTLSTESKEALKQLALRHGAYNVRLFGSVARGESRLSSDVDLLVEMHPNRTLFDLVGFWQDAEDLLGCKVDVVSERGLSPYLRDRILQEAVPL